MKIASVDCETTGTNIAAGHRPWEIAVVREDGEEYHKFFPVDLNVAEPVALKIGGYWEVGRRPNRLIDYSRRDLMDLCELLNGYTIMGCAVHFDVAMITAALKDHDLMHSFGHRHLDLGSYYAGYRNQDYPASSKTMQEEFPNDEAHTALGDARWNMHVYKELTTA